MTDTEVLRAKIIELENRIAEIEGDYEEFKRRYLVKYDKDNELLGAIAEKFKRYGDRFEVLGEIVLKHSEYLWPEGAPEMRQRLQRGMTRDDKGV